VRPGGEGAEECRRPQPARLRRHAGHASDIDAAKAMIEVLVPPEAFQTAERAYWQQVLSPEAWSLGSGDGNRGEEALRYAARTDVAMSHDDRALGRQEPAGARPARQLGPVGVQVEPDRGGRVRGQF